MSANKANKIPFCWNLLVLAFLTHPPLLAACFTAIMSKFMMSLAVRQLIQLAAMSVWKYSSVLQPTHFLWLTLTQPFNSVHAPVLPTHSAHKQELSHSCGGIYSDAQWVWGALTVEWRESLHLALEVQPTSYTIPPRMRQDTFLEGERF